MPASDDLYEILQVHPSAHPEVIQAAYRRLAQLYHPDRNPSPDAAERMAAINHAYDVLGDTQKRAAYDQERNEGGSNRTDRGPYQEVVRAKSFELVNDVGALRARLAVDDDGEPQLTMLDKNGNYRLALFQSDDGTSGLVLLDQNGKHRLRLGTSDTGSPYIDISDGNNDTRLWLGEADDGGPMLFMADRNGNRRFELILSRRGSPHWTMRDANGDPKIWAVIEDGGKLELGKESWW